METSKVIQICRERNEIEFLFQITKKIAESDSIGEGYEYCREYTREMFNNAEEHIPSLEMQQRGADNEYCQYLEWGAIPIYELYLKQINVELTSV